MKSTEKCIRGRKEGRRDEEKGRDGKDDDDRHRQCPPKSA